MKILAGGDLHITDQKPENRLDDYFETLSGKVKWIFEFGKEKGCDIIALPGDIFNTHRANDFLKQHLIKIIIQYGFENKVLVSFGQHDQRYHSTDRSNTPLNVLDAANIVKVLGEFPLIYPGDKVAFYGASFEEDIPPITTKDFFNVLVTHRMIIEEKLWEGQEEFDRSNLLLRQNDFDLIISGDNHNTFITKSGKKTLINCGSLMRSNIDQANHKPCIFIYDTVSREAIRYDIPVKPFEEIMNIEDAVEDKKHDERMAAYIKTLDGNVEIKGMKFKMNLKTYIAANEVEEGVQDIFGEVIE